MSRATEDASRELSQLVAEVRALREAVDRVRMVHIGCPNWCPTLVALRGE